MGSRGLEVSDVTCEGGGAARQVHSVGAQFSPAWGTTASPIQPPSLAILESSPPSCYSPPASVPKERLQLGHSHPPPIPLASRSAGRQVRAVCSLQTSPDRRLLVGPRSEPCRSSRPTTSCFQTIPQSGSPGLKGEVCPLLSWKPGWQSAQRKILFLSSQMRSHFRQVGQRQATGWWGVGGLPQSRSGSPTPITGSKGGPVGIRQDLPQGTGCSPGGRAGAVCQPLSPSLSPAVFGHLALCWPEAA